MKSTLILVSFLLSVGLAQANNDPIMEDIKVGSELVIGAPSSNSYMHIKLPRKNFVIKKGGIPDYKSITKKTVVISEMNELPDGTVEVYLKRKNGKLFFNSHRRIKAKLKQALTAEELVKR